MSDWKISDNEQNLKTIFEQFGKMDIPSRGKSMLGLANYLKGNDFMSALQDYLELAGKGLNEGLINPAAMYYCILQFENIQKAFEAMLHAKVTNRDLEWREFINLFHKKDKRKIEDLIRGVNDDSDDE